MATLVDSQKNLRKPTPSVRTDLYELIVVNLQVRCVIAHIVCS